MILLIDNYDSFVHNLARYLRLLGARTEIVRNDRISVSDVLEQDFDGVILSPGPCTPDQAGICVDLVRQAKSQLPVLGICLGHQAIGQAYDAKLYKLRQPMHGKASVLNHDGRGIFVDIPDHVAVGRYHSLAIELPSAGPLVETAFCSEADGTRTIMAVAHQHHPHVGLQFHPESVLTDHGSLYLENFLSFARNWRASQLAVKDAAQ